MKKNHKIMRAETEFVLLVTRQYVISGSARGLMGVAEERPVRGTIRKRDSLTVHQFLKANAHWIKMDGGIDVTVQ